ncbi:hypothetical protein QL285_048105 [Trifolium repens]|jgi:hypothetical protein|nr:hypothetical protein QL285_048105 [Trifolium repens]
MKENNKHTHLSNLHTYLNDPNKTRNKVLLNENINKVYIHPKLHSSNKIPVFTSKHKPLVFKTNKSDMDDVAASSIVNLGVKNKTRKCRGYISATETVQVRS